MARSNEPTWCKCWANKGRHWAAGIVLAALGSSQLLTPLQTVAHPSLAPTFECQQTASQVEHAKQSAAQKDYAAAIGEFRALLDACPEDRAAALELTRTYLDARQFNAAQKTATQILTLAPQSKDAQFLLAYSYFMLERFPEAGKTLQKLLAQDSKNPDAHKLMGLTLFFYKEYALAESELLTALRDRPRDQEALYYLGRVYYTQNSFAPATGIFLRLLRESPKSYKGYDNLGLCYEALGKTVDAEKAFKKAQALAGEADPAYDWPYANLAEMLIKLNRIDEALPYAREAARINPTSARDQYLLGKALSRGSDWEASIEVLRKSAELDANYAEPHYVLGQLYRKLGRSQEANLEFAVFQKIGKKPPGKKE